MVPYPRNCVLEDVRALWKNSRELDFLEDFVRFIDCVHRDDLRAALNACKLQLQLRLLQIIQRIAVLSPLANGRSRFSRIYCTKWYVHATITFQLVCYCDSILAVSFWKQCASVKMPIRAKDGIDRVPIQFRMTREFVSFKRTRVQLTDAHAPVAPMKN